MPILKGYFRYYIWLGNDTPKGYNSLMDISKRLGWRVPNDEELKQVVDEINSDGSHEYMHLVITSPELYVV